MLSMGTMAAQHMHWSISMATSLISDGVYMNLHLIFYLSYFYLNLSIVMR